MITKPTLPIGWKLPGEITVQGRLDRKFFVEIFKLDDSTFLYLFHKPEIRARIQERQIEHDRILLGGTEHIGKRYPSHSDELLVKRLEEIETLTGLDAIAGMAELKSILLRDVIHPLQHKAEYARYKLTIPNGVLFYGPPGCGKTYISRRIAEALHVPLIESRESDLGSPYIHATSKNIAQVFKKAAATAPCVLFFDELSSLVPKRDALGSSEHYKESEVSEFLTQLEGAGAKGILVIGATNYPERIDDAVLRSGRMDKRIFIPPPDYAARIELFKLMLDGRPYDKNLPFEVFATLTEGYVASDIRLLIDNAARGALGEQSEIDADCMHKALSGFRSSLSPETIQRYSASLGFERK